MNTKLVNYAAWLSLLTILIFPGRPGETGMASSTYGFPFAFLTDYHHAPNGKQIWFIKGVNLNLLGFFLNIVFFYVVLLVITRMAAAYAAKKQRKSSI
ncbi:hypothetical protein J40TS1_36880 [Paenibacillus montaniterrae]|uniref:Uncharacterized protein n=1 Tax=Paenibacillus montaniterrae TaxID=429341 RepID=A0A919YTB9_9BACL|nr:hypothetical protein [Paenibacillus montaniterrae]GIP18046.1 hypothetical protein J40TS1_36880 [Paenibacillus montaniterrae]